MRYKKIAVIVALLAMVSCGGTTTEEETTDGGTTAEEETDDTTAPTISSVKDANGATVETTGTIGVIPTSFDITFSGAMDDASVTTEGNITLSCDHSGDADISVEAAESEENTYMVTVTDAYKHGYDECILTVTTNVKNAAGVPFASAVAYTFDNACATSDDFLANTFEFTTGDDTEGSCWTYSTTNASPRATYFTVSDGVMVYDTGDIGPIDFTGEDGQMIYKTFDVGPFSATLEIQSQSLEAENNTCHLLFTDGDSDPFVLFSYHDPSDYCQLGVMIGDDPAEEYKDANSCPTKPSSDNPLYLQVTWDGTNVNGRYRYGSTGDLTAVDGSNPDGAAITLNGGSIWMGLWCGSNQVNFQANIGSFIVEGLTATGPGTQY